MNTIYYIMAGIALLILATILLDRAFKWFKGEVR
jgi:glucose dehydrogenase